MKKIVTAALCCGLFGVVLCGGARGQDRDPIGGDVAFAAGNFDAAALAYRAALEKNPRDADAELGLGTVELYRNNLDAARAHLRQALALDQGSTKARARLAAVDERVGAPSDYRIAFDGSQARVPFVAIDPVPTIQAKIDGLVVTLAIDTGAPSIDLSQAIVEKLRLPTQVAGEGVFAGGRRAQLRSVRIDRLDLPGVTVRGIPGGVAPRVFKGIDGIVGTGFLYHFLSTIDYAQRVLVLRPSEDSERFRASAEASGATAVPMWLVGDHFIFAPAHVNDAPDALYAIDTGGPGIGVDLSKSALAAAGITPDASHPQSFQGGGGSVRILTFIAASVTVGGVTLRNLPGVYFPEGSMHDALPFAVAGSISHEFFRHTAVTLDFRSMTLVLARS